MAQFRINEANLRKTIAFLREEPNRFTMLIWGYHSDAETTETFKKDLRNALAAHDEAVISIARKERPPCGTVCCFAGGVEILVNEIELKLAFVDVEIKL